MGYKKTAGSISIAVLDTGINASHSDLSANIDKARAYNAVTNSINVVDSSGHGTHVAGIVGAVANNGKGVAGVSYNAKVIPIKVSAADGSISTSVLCKAYDYLIDQVKSGGLTNLRVINMSLGHYETGQGSAALKAKIADAKDLKIVTVCSAGNGAEKTEHYISASTMKNHFPSSYDDCISVAACTKEGVRAAYSTYGARVDITAPGSDIYSTSRTGGYEYLSGTSMAAPLVSGVAGLLYAYNPGLSVDQVKDILCKSAVDLSGQFVNARGYTIKYGSGKDVATGYGLINAASALEEVVNRAKKTTWVRRGGKTQYATGRIVNVGTFTKADTVIIACGESYTDAISAASLAGKLNAPVLLTAPNALSPDTSSAIKQLGATKAVIVGGKYAVSLGVEQSLKAMLKSVSRVSGSTYIDTCLKIHNQLGTSHSNTAIVACGTNYPDALSVSSFSYASKSHVFLTQADGTLNQATVNAIKNGGYTNVLIVGGKLAVKESVQSQLSGAGRKLLRLSGATQYATCASIVKWETGKMPSAKFQPSTLLNFTNIFLSSGQSYADSLSASSSAGRLKAALLLCDNTEIGRYCAANVISPYKASLKKGIVVGGRSAVSSGTMNVFMNAGN